MRWSPAFTIIVFFLASQKLVRVTADGSLDCGGEILSLHSHPDINRVVEVGCVCNNAQLQEGKLLGHPTEGALLAVSHKVDSVTYFFTVMWLCSVVMWQFVVMWLVCDWVVWLICIIMWLVHMSMWLSSIIMWLVCMFMWSVSVTVYYTICLEMCFCHLSACVMWSVTVIMWLVAFDHVIVACVHTLLTNYRWVFMTWGSILFARMNARSAQATSGWLCWCRRGLSILLLWWADIFQSTTVSLLDLITLKSGLNACPIHVQRTLINITIQLNLLKDCCTCAR